VAAPPPAAHPDRKVVDGYGPGVFTIRGERHDGSLILLPDAILPWRPADIAALGIADFETFASLPPERRPSILLIGMGARGQFLKPVVRAALRELGMVADTMDTGAACRTYNVLLAEERRVAACLFAL
jgi:uncharacterized protein